MKRILMLFVAVLTWPLLEAQDINTIITLKDVDRIERTLSSDDMMGRAVFKPGIEKAQQFIAGEFKAASLQAYDSAPDFLQTFTITRTKFSDAAALFDGTVVPTRNIVAFTSDPNLYVTQDSGYIKAYIKPGDDFNAAVSKYVESEKSYLVIVDTSFAKNLRGMPAMHRTKLKTKRSTLFILSMKDPSKYEISVKHEETNPSLANVIGIIPGKSKKDEFVVFSAHHDHFGTGRPNENKDSIYNGANDDASGCTAVIMLAKYFKAVGGNERTLVFVTFTGEETGGYGSRHFSNSIDPARVIAMFNIEMIGTQSKWGTNSAFITGYEKSDFGSLLQANLAQSIFKFYPDPYPDKNLFYRSDNATLASLGVPAHSISTSKMDSEINYHKVTDEVETLDLGNMTEIIKAIALSAIPIVAGKETPTRVSVQKK